LRRGWRRVRPASEGKTSSRVSGEPRWPLGGRSARTAAASCKRHGQRCRNAAARPGSGQGRADEMAFLWFGPSEDSDRAATSSISPLTVGQNSVQNEIISFRPATTVYESSASCCDPTTVAEGDVTFHQNTTIILC
jgi:hypothetical protein